VLITAETVQNQLRRRGTTAPCCGWASGGSRGRLPRRKVARFWLAVPARLEVKNKTSKFALRISRFLNLRKGGEEGGGREEEERGR
jgi:hypothetical protein